MFTTKLSNAAFLTLAASMVASAQTPFVIANVHSALVLDVPADLETLPFTMINQATPSGGTNQQWTLHRPTGATAYEIRSVGSGMVIDTPVAASGITIQQAPANGTKNQLWQLSRAMGEAGYEIASVNLVDGPSNCSGSLCLANFVPLVLDVPAFSTTAGTLIQVYTENSGTNQQWAFQPVFPSLEAAIHLGHFVQVSAGSNTVTIDGSGFSPNSEVCPVLDSLIGAGAYFTTAPCITTSTLGMFSYAFPLPQGFTFVSSKQGDSGYVVVTIEDKNQNVLAIGGVAASLAYNTK
jgi:hypothetical protein